MYSERCLTNVLASITCRLMQSATKREHKAKAAQAITLASRSAGVFPLFLPLFFFFCETRCKDGRDAERETRRCYPRTISSTVRGPERARTRECLQYTQRRRAMYRRHTHRTYTRSCTHTHARNSLLSRHFRSFTTECNFVPTWHMAHSDTTSRATDYRFVCASRHFETQ